VLNFSGYTEAQRSVQWQRSLLEKDVDLVGAYTREFKAEAVQMLLDGHSAASIAKNPGAQRHRSSLPLLPLIKRRATFTTSSKYRCLFSVHLQ